MLGIPTVEAWPELDALPHWRADTEGIRTVCCRRFVRLLAKSLNARVNPPRQKALWQHNACAVGLPTKEISLRG